MAERSSDQVRTPIIDKVRQYADIAVTYTANEFQGVYRGKQYHEPDFEDVLSRAQAAGCTKIMLTTMTLDGACQNLEMCRKFSGLCYMTLGVHPYHASELYASTNSVAAVTATTTHDMINTMDNDNDNTTLAALITLGKSLTAEQNSPLVAFGEIGLDYHYLERSTKEDQRRAFTQQLEIATTHFPTLPLFLHARDATHDLIEIIRPFLPKLKHNLNLNLSTSKSRLAQTKPSDKSENDPQRESGTESEGASLGIIHSFAGTKDEMLTLVDLGFHISVNAISFKTPELIEMVRAIPLTHLQLETDAPWCTMPALTSSNSNYPVEVVEALKDAPALPISRDRRKFVKGCMVKDRNKSCVIERVATVVARVKEVDLDVVVRNAWQNSTRMFGLGVHPNI